LIYINFDEIILCLPLKFILAVSVKTDDIINVVNYNILFSWIACVTRLRSSKIRRHWAVNQRVIENCIIKTILVSEIIRIGISIFIEDDEILYKCLYNFELLVYTFYKGWSRFSLNVCIILAYLYILCQQKGIHIN
jgi:hypothetical protein